LREGGPVCHRFPLDISIQFRSQFLWMHLIYNPGVGSPAICLLNNFHGSGSPQDIQGINHKFRDLRN